MPKVIPVALQSMVAAEVSTFAVCLDATLLDGRTFGFTNHNDDITIPETGITYKAETGFFGSEIEWAAQLSVSNLEAQGFLNSDSIVEAELEAGEWDYARIRVMYVNWKDPSQGIIKQVKGFLGEVRTGRAAFVAEVNGLNRILQLSVGRVVEPSCDAYFGDARCKVRVNPPAWTAVTAYTVRQAGEAESGSVVRPTSYNDRHFKCITAGTSGAVEPSWSLGIGSTTNDGTVVWESIQALTVQGTLTAVTNRRLFADSTRNEADNQYREGVITMTSGLNTGLSREVKSSANSGGVIELQQPFPYDLAIGDAYTMVAGCQKAFEDDCIDRFDNAANFQGFPDVPMSDKAMSGRG